MPSPVAVATLLRIANRKFPGSEDGQDLLELAPNERAAAGVFLGFQYPVEIPGVSNVQFSAPTMVRTSRTSLV